MRGGNRSSPHTSLLGACEEYLRLHGAWTLRVVGGLGTRRGSPDMVAGLEGQLLCIEAKTGKAVLSAVQQVERERIIAAGGLYIEARDVADIEEALVAAGLVRARSLWPKREG